MSRDERLRHPPRCRPLGTREPRIRGNRRRLRWKSTGGSRGRLRTLPPQGARVFHKATPGRRRASRAVRRRRVAARRRAPRARPRNPVRARFRGTTGGTRRWDGRRGVPSSRTRRRKIPLRRKRRENPETKTRRETRRGNGERLRIGTDGSPGLPRTRRRRRRETRTSVLRRRSDAGVGRQKRKHVIDELAS